jgi:UDP-N-acetylglucosamine 2-epimerase (non-hydrolysing)
MVSLGSGRYAHLLSIVGTRPEAIKIAPIALAAARRPWLTHRILATGQHDALFDDALADFGLAPDLRLGPLIRESDPDIMVERLSAAMEPVLRTAAPDLVLVQGDTNSALAGALAAHRLGIPLAHVEAGLRSFDLQQPWPEERNRVLIDRIADLLFAPTRQASANLAADPDVRGIVQATGNTGIDALLLTRARIATPPPPSPGLPSLILLTAHRRENIGEGIERICAAALRLAARGGVIILCPVHPNPAVGGDTVAAMAAARLILTDSGGIQEEAPALGIPTLVLRDVTERPEALTTGNLVLVGTDTDAIVATASRLLDDPAAHAAMARPAFPFGHGDAAEKILDGVEQYFSSDPAREHPLPFTPVWTKDGGPKGA